ncbi:MAG TPA: deoxyribodipyrimidine photo-lyase, partial [Polyangiaceae bacterium]|nr:deoxyribodipyrimidine photo-lyase [Polyangiaceae bacterium]
MRTLVWFRGKDLRLADHAPLVEAVRGGEVIPLFVLDPYFFAPARARQLPHRMQFLLESLDSLARNIAAKGSRLLLVAG